MNITIDIRCLMHSHYSGVGEYTFNLLDNLFKIDKQNQYQLFYNASQNVKANLPRFAYSHVKFIGFKYPNKLFNFSLKFLKQPKLDQIIGKTNIFFLPNLNFATFSKNCKKIITIHDLSFELYPQFFSLKHQFWHRMINPKKLVAQFDKIITVSENTKNDLINLYHLPENKIRVIYSGLDHLHYQKLDPSLPKFKQIKAKYQLPKSFILFLGTLEPRKNIVGLIESFNLLKDKYQEYKNLHLIIAGEKGWNYEKIFELANNSPYTNQIFYLDYVSHQDKPYLYNLAKLFIFPSFYEGFGFPPLEAQACAVPVIASANSSFPEILGDSAFLIKPDDISEIASVIHQILSNQELKENLIKKGLENVKRFSWSKTAQETLNYLLT